jgi:hypothetical protein
MYNVTLTLVRVTVVAVRKVISITYSLCVCVCVCVWVGGCWGAWARACARVALLIPHATRMPNIVASFVASGVTQFCKIIS